MVVEELSRSIADFIGTTQERHWILTAEKLAELRCEANKVAAHAVRDAHSAAAEHVTDTDPSPGKRARTDEHVPDCLTVAEEHFLQDCYIAHLQKISSETLKLPLSVEGTALAYFKRFYLFNSGMDYHPKDIMITVLWLACKVEHYPSRFVSAQKVRLGDSIKDFAFDALSFAELGRTKKVNLPISQLLRLEQVLLASIKYHLMVFHPYRGLRGLVESWTAVARGALAPQLADRILVGGNDKLREWLKTDAPLLFHPAALALAALKWSVKAIKKDLPPPDYSATKASLDNFLMDSFEGAVQEVQSLADRCKEIENAVSGYAKQRLKEVCGKEKDEQRLAACQRLEDKLSWCGNPAKERNHPLFEQIEDAKRSNRDGIKLTKILAVAEQERQKQYELLGLNPSGQGGGDMESRDFRLSTREIKSEHEP